jgi:uncharacterized protein
MTRSVHVGFSLYPTDEAYAAALPLIEAGIVDALEWTVDVTFGWDAVPDRVSALLDPFADRLYGHGVCLSPTTARFDATAAAWLCELARDRRRYRHVTEHWGFSRAGQIARGAPLPLPASSAVVAATTHALRALAEVVRAPIGLENLALALSADELDSQPAMLAQTLAAVDGVLLLDLHNVWCQAVNFERDVRELIARYPLDRVRQIHVAGGGWSESSYGKPVRRDTHDGWVPAEVMELVAWTIPRCPALEVVVLERIPGALELASTHGPWRDEWRTLADIVRAAAREPMVAVPAAMHAVLPVHSLDELARYQDAIADVLVADRTSPAHAAHAVLLAHPDTAPFRDEVRRWELRALEVAIALVDKWSVLA